KAPPAHIDDTRGRDRGTAVPAVIICIDGQASQCEDFDCAEVASDILTHPMRDLHHAAFGAAAVPTNACNVQAVSAVESELGGSNHHALPRSADGSELLDIDRPGELLHALPRDK